MGFVVAIAVALLLVVFLGVYLRRRGNTSQLWDGRSSESQAQRKFGDTDIGGY